MKAVKREGMERVAEEERKYDDLVSRADKIRADNSNIEKFPHTIEEYSKQRGIEYEPITSELILILSDHDCFSPSSWEDSSALRKYVTKLEKVIQAGCEVYVLHQRHKKVGKSYYMSLCAGASRPRYYEYEEEWGLPVRRKLQEKKI